MAFFRKWKNSAKHSKLSEEWALATSMKSFAANSDDIDTDSEEPESFDVKYLGSTIVDQARSEEATAEAVKSVIMTAKASRKKLQHVTLCVSPKGIELADATTGDSILQVSIYKISYCSADAAHPDVFAFVGTECGPDIDPLDEQLTCYAFQCAKRKHAQKVTLTVAHSFEQAYRIWQDATQRKQYQQDRRAQRKQQQQAVSSGAPCVSSAAAAKSAYRSASSNSCSDGDDHHHPHAAGNSLLIDFGCTDAADDLFDKDRHRSSLQNTWVSFDDDSDDALVQQQRHQPISTVWDTTLKSNHV